MQSLWTDAEAATFDGSLAQRVYTSRLLGRDHSLTQRYASHYARLLVQTGRLPEALTLAQAALGSLSRRAFQPIALSMIASQSGWS